MTPRTLAILNAIGCLVLATLVVLQWRAERVVRKKTEQLRTELAASHEQAAAQAQRNAALERDIAVLKESIEATQKAAETAARGLAEKDELAGNLEAALAAAREQVSAWETALAARDERIRALEDDLAATRRRLEEAIAKLKAAGAR